MSLQPKYASTKLIHLRWCPLIGITISTSILNWRLCWGYTSTTSPVTNSCTLFIGDTFKYSSWWSKQNNTYTIKKTQNTTCRTGIIYFCTCKPVQQKAGCDTNALFRNELCRSIEPTYMHSHTFIPIHHYHLTKFITKSHPLNKWTFFEHTETTHSNPQINLRATI